MRRPPSTKGRTGAPRAVEGATGEGLRRGTAPAGEASALERERRFADAAGDDTQRYMHLSPAALENAIRLLETDTRPKPVGDTLEVAGA